MKLTPRAVEVASFAAFTLGTAADVPFFTAAAAAPFVVAVLNASLACFASSSASAIGNNDAAMSCAFESRMRLSTKRHAGSFEFATRAARVSIAVGFDGFGDVPSVFPPMSIVENENENVDDE